jgi:hypothetical protein
MAGRNGCKVMSNELEPRPASSQPVIYQIRIKGHLGCEWNDWFDGLTIKLEDNGDTLLTGPVVDQAALHGFLRKVRDLGMPLVSVIPVEPGSSPALGSGPADGSSIESKAGGCGLMTPDSITIRRTK